MVNNKCVKNTCLRWKKERDRIRKENKGKKNETMREEGKGGYFRSIQDAFERMKK